MFCNYRNCSYELHDYENGNRHYCDDECYNAEKLARSKDNYIRKKKHLAEIDRIEALLRVCHNKYGDSLTDINVLRAEKMNWSFNTGQTTIDGLAFFVVGSYAYRAFDNSTIKIINIKKQ